MPTLGKQLEQALNGYAPRMQTQANRFGTNLVNISDVLLDPAYNLQGAWNHGTFRANVTDPLSFASCYPTAQALFPVLVGGGANPLNGSNPQGRYSDANALRAELANLVGRMRQAATARGDVVFRIELAGHGFTLVFRNDESGQYQAELIECLAHATSLTRSLTFDPKPVDGVIQALQAIFSDDINARTAGAAYFGWNATGLYLGAQYNADPVFPNIIFRWWSANLDAGWGTRWLQQFVNRLTFLEAN